MCGGARRSASGRGSGWRWCGRWAVAGSGHRTPPCAATSVLVQNLSCVSTISGHRRSAASISASIEAGVRTGDCVWGAALPPIRVARRAPARQPGHGRQGLSGAAAARRARDRRPARHPGAVPPGGRRAALRAAAAGPGRRARSLLRRARPAPAAAARVRTCARSPARCGAAARATRRPAPCPSCSTRPGPRLAADGVPGRRCRDHRHRRRARRDRAPAHRPSAPRRRGRRSRIRAGPTCSIWSPRWACAPCPSRSTTRARCPEALAAALAAGVAGGRGHHARAQPDRRRGHRRPCRRAARGAGRAPRRAADRGRSRRRAGRCAAALPRPVRPRTWAFVRSASKPYGPDLRIAVLAGDPATVARVAGRMRHRRRLGVHRPAATAAAPVARRRRSPPRWPRPPSDYRRRRHALRDALSQRGLQAHGSTGINVWVSRARRDPRGRRAARCRLCGRPGLAASGSHAPPGIRITVSPLGDGDIVPLADAVAAAVRPGHPAPP